MHETMNRLALNARSRSVELLAENLIHLADLERQAKLAHWNVRGPNFAALHLMFDQVADQTRDFVDSVAERIVALGGIADARSQTVSAQTRLADYPLQAFSSDQHVEALAAAIAVVAENMRDAIEQSAGWGDLITSDLVGEIGRELEKSLWLVEAHRSVEPKVRAIVETPPRRRLEFVSQNVY